MYGFRAIYVGRLFLARQQFQKKGCKFLQPFSRDCFVPGMSETEGNSAHSVEALHGITEPTVVSEGGKIVEGCPE